MVYPRLENIRDITAHVALEVIKTAAAEGRLRGRAADKLARSEARLLDYINESMFNPAYTSLVPLPVGVHQ